MYIKSINNVVGYKDLPDGLNVEFDENKTYIVGANFQGKTTIGSIFNWCLTGTNLNGVEKEQIANKLKILVIEAQKEKIKQYLNKVDIEFSKVAKTTGEITECCNIQYEGRDFKKLSKSEQARACLELSNVFNNISGINAPIFFDDAESTTDIQEIPGTQLIISLVIKYNKLEILYDYEDVLERKEASIKKEIQEKSCYEIPLAA